MPDSRLDGLRTLRVVVQGWQIQGERRDLEHRVWYEAPARVRCETRVGTYQHLVVSDGRRRWWSYDPSEMRVDEESSEYVSAGEVAGSFLDPSELLRSLEIESLGDVTLLGRPARIVRGRPTGDELEEADRLALAIDRASGLILRRDGWLDGVHSSHAEVVELAIDEPIPDQVFTYAAPPGVRVRHHGELERAFEALPRTLEESAPLMPFRVYVLPDSEAGWTLEDARPSLPDDATDLGPHLCLDYSRLRAGDFERLHVWEWGDESEELRVERGAGPFTVVALGQAKGRDKAKEPASVLAAMGRTRVQLVSLEVEEDLLVELARTLVPFDPA